MQVPVVLGVWVLESACIASCEHVCTSLPKSLFGHFRFSSLEFSCSVVSDSLRPLGLQHTRPPCPSPTSGVYSNSRPLSR